MLAYDYCKVKDALNNSKILFEAIQKCHLLTKNHIMVPTNIHG
jgi:hypothetical protein